MEFEQPNETSWQQPYYMGTQIVTKDIDFVFCKFLGRYPLNDIIAAIKYYSYLNFINSKISINFLDHINSNNILLLTSYPYFLLFISYKLLETGHYSLDTSYLTLISSH